jgi:hypothetical protein
MTRRDRAAACVALLVMAWTAALCFAFEPKTAETRRLSTNDSWQYEGEVELRPGYGGNCYSPPVCLEYCSAGYCPHGFGHLGTDASWSYDGTFVHGRIEGVGVYENDFYRYVGGFKAGLFDGHGVLTCGSGGRFEGTFVHGYMRRQFNIGPPDEHGTGQVFSDTWVGWEGPCKVP